MDTISIHMEQVMHAFVALVLKQNKHVGPLEYNHSMNQELIHKLHNWVLDSMQSWAHDLIHNFTRTLLS